MYPETTVTHELSGAPRARRFVDEREMLDALQVELAGNP